MKSKIVSLYTKFNIGTSKLKDIPLLMLRLILAYGLFGPAKMKLLNPDGVTKFFTKLDIPFPTFNVYLAGITEGLGVILLILGFGTKIISIPLMFTMVVAIVTVHWENGFSAGDNGFQIPFYFMIMMFTLLVYGPGRISIDYLFGKKRNN